MNPFRFTTIAHARSDWLGPLSPASFDRILDVLGDPPLLAVDIGCGKGALLVRVLTRFPNCVAIGVEPNPEFASAARQNLELGGVSDRATVFVQPLERVVLPERSFDLVICVGATHAFGDTRDALAGAGRLARSNAHVLIGDGHWQRPPARGYLDLLGCGPEAHASFADTVALGIDAGLTHVCSHVSSMAEWDAYEDTYAASVRSWAGAHADDPDAPAFLERIERWSDGRQRWGRDTLGFALHLYRTPEEP